jgi:hypothetical protein
MLISTFTIDGIRLRKERNLTLGLTFASYLPIRCITNESEEG